MSREAKKRVKSEAVTIKNWSEADSIVRRIARLKNKIDNEELKSKLQIEAIKKDLADSAKKLNEEIKRDVISLENFSSSHKTEFGKNRSRQLVHGVIGWRKSFSVKIGKNTLGLIKKIFSKARQATLIRVKESVDKNGLAKLGLEELHKVGANIKVKDVFFVDVGKNKAVEY